MVKTLVTGLFFIIALHSAIVQAIEVKDLNPVELLQIKSKHFTGLIDYNVTLPKSYNEAKGKDKKYFVVFDLHPRSQPYLSGLHDWLSHNGEWPWLESIVITPANYNAEFAKLFENIANEPSSQIILDYFEHDLLTAIDEKYSTNGFKIYSGFMGNGALGLFTLLNRPKLFNAYIISSPSLANDFGSITTQAKTKLAIKDDQMRFLYLATGNHQYEQGNLPAFDLFETALETSAPETLEWHVQRNLNSHYMSQPVISIIKGVEALFDDIHTDLAADSEISQHGPQAIIDYYALISTKKYGFAVSAEGSLKALAKSFMTSNSQKALSLYQQVVTLYPESAYALSALANAYADQGDINQAIEYQTLAVEKSKSMITWHQKKHKSYLDTYLKERASQGE